MGSRLSAQRFIRSLTTRPNAPTAAAVSGERRFVPILLTLGLLVIGQPPHTLGLRYWDMIKANRR